MIGRQRKPQDEYFPSLRPQPEDRGHELPETRSDRSPHPGQSIRSVAQRGGRSTLRQVDKGVFCNACSKAIAVGTVHIVIDDQCPLPSPIE